MNSDAESWECFAIYIYIYSSKQDCFKNQEFIYELEDKIISYSTWNEDGFYYSRNNNHG